MQLQHAEPAADDFVATSGDGPIWPTGSFYGREEHFAGAVGAYIYDPAPPVPIIASLLLPHSPRKSLATQSKDMQSLGIMCLLS